MPAATLLVSAIVCGVLDQATKALALAHVRTGGTRSFRWFAIRKVLNLGGGGFLSGRRALATLWVVEVVALVALVQAGPFVDSTTAQVALGAALGGASGNLCDRLWRGGVVDFIDLRVWPVFNLADAAIVAGALTAAIFLWTGAPS